MTYCTGPVRLCPREGARYTARRLAVLLPRAIGLASVHLIRGEPEL